MERGEKVPLKMIHSWRPQLSTDGTVSIGTRDKHLRAVGCATCRSRLKEINLYWVYSNLKFIIQPFDNISLFSN